MPATAVTGGAFGFEKRLANSGVLGGLGLMLAAVVWFVLGLLLAERIFIYPPIMFIIGLVAIVKCVAGSE